MCRCLGRTTTSLRLPATPADRLRQHVHKLSGELGEHNWQYLAKLNAAADYIESVWRQQGYAVTRYPYTAEGMQFANLEVTRPGTTRPNEIVVIGAHYDSVEGSPGANDNSSGVAAMLEMSGHFTRLRPACTIRFVAFVNEEPPYFETEHQGSRVYAKLCRQRGDDIHAMLSLETLGYYSEAPGSQNYPAPFGLFYPGRGNFVAFVSNLRSRSAMHEAVRAFRGHSDVPVECCATFERVEGVGWSDHASFWREGYPAMMVTDTAIFRYPHYHAASDTPDKVNYELLARVTDGLCGMLAVMAGGVEVDLLSLWDWDNPAESERRFRELPASDEVLTQIARAQGLQGKFDEAHKTLDAVNTNSPRVAVRYLLERGRVFNSAGKPDQARPLFAAAWDKARAGQLDFFAVDAAHMLGILDGLEWHEKAIALAQSSPDPQAQGWMGSLLNNLGWTYYDRGEYGKALEVFERDLQWFEQRQKHKEAGIAREAIAECRKKLPPAT